MFSMWNESTFFFLLLMFLCLHICFNFSTTIIFLFIFSLCILGILQLSRNTISSFTVLLKYQTADSLDGEPTVAKGCISFVCSELCQQAQRVGDCVFYITKWICESWSSQGPACPAALCDHLGKFKHFLFSPQIKCMFSLAFLLLSLVNPFQTRKF